jgi:hypothetical protein
MSRTSFFNRPSSSSRDKSPLLPQHRNSVSLQNLSPSATTSRSIASESPPPSFYRDQFRDEESEHAAYSDNSGSPSRTRFRDPRGRGDDGGKQIMFNGPPAPVAQSMLLLSLPKDNGSGRSSSSSNSKPRYTSPNLHTSLRIRRSSGGSLDPLLVIERKEKAIQQELQLLLDAQSTGLVQGFGQDVGGDGGSDAGSSTPTMSRSFREDGSTGRSRERERGIVPVRQPKKKPLSLRGARKALLKDMRTLANVKVEESSILRDEIARREEVLSRVREWEGRITSVQKELSGAASGEEDTSLSLLTDEERKVDTEIRDLEERLLQLRARKRWLGERIRENENRREARLSSYRGALKDVEREVKIFLDRPGIERSIAMASSEEEHFTALPPKRRTLGMAKEWFIKEKKELGARLENSKLEKNALLEGAEIWAQSMELVMRFEDELRLQMQGQLGEEKLRETVSRMGGIVSKLEKSLETAEKKGWNLLVAAIGAEVEAFREGETMLRSVLGVTDEAAETPKVKSSGTWEEDREEEREESFHSTEDGLEVVVEGLNGGTLQRLDSREESEDDGPPAEFMVEDKGSQQDGDGELD